MLITHRSFTSTRTCRRFLPTARRFRPAMEETASEPINVITVTGVGSSALGSVAFAWNVSEALRQPIAAIVPGYGLADLIPQALGGWFGFGVHDFLCRITQQVLSDV